MTIIFSVAAEVAIGFAAFNPDGGSFSNGNRVTFGQTITNVGDAYSTADSVFTCPVNGLYLFTVHFQTAGNEPGNVVISHNSVHLVTAYSDYASWDGAGTTVVVECLVGDRVEIICDPHDSCQLSADLDGTNAAGLLSFSGILVSTT